MGESITLRVDIFRTPDNKPTCAKDVRNGQVCMFLNQRKMGQIDCCGITFEDLARSDGWDIGWLVPSDRCPLWEKIR